MSLKLAAVGTVAAIGLGVWAGGHLQPRLAVPTQTSSAPMLAEAGVAGPIDLTPAYVSPASLAAWREADAPAAFEPDRVDQQVRRELASAAEELRASDSALDDYRRAAVLVADAAAAAREVAGVLLTESSEAVGLAAGRPSAMAPASDGVSRWSQD